MTLVQQLAEDVTRLSLSAIPARALEQAKVCLLYNLSVAFTSHDENDPVLATAKTIYGSGAGASLFVTGEALTPAHAAYANAAMIGARGQNDTLMDAQTHFGCVVIPAVLAAAEQRKASLGDVLTAMVCGYQIQAEIAAGAGGTKRGFRPTPVFGVFGAAAGAARILGLSAEATAHALAIASNFSSGTLQCWADGSMEWRLHIPHACHCGFTAALLAQAGLSGAKHALEGNSGFYAAFAAAQSTARAKPWAIERIAFKPYPGCAFNQSTIVALTALIRQQAIPPERIARVDVWLCPAEYAYPGVDAYGPFASSAGAIMSSQFMVAATLRDGAPRRDHFVTGYSDPALLARAKSATVHADDTLGAGCCRVRLVTDAGAIFETTATSDDLVFGWDAMTELSTNLSQEWPSANTKAWADELKEIVATMPENVGVDRLMLACTAPEYRKRARP